MCALTTQVCHDYKLEVICFSNGYIVVCMLYHGYSIALQCAQCLYLANLCTEIRQ